MKKRSIMTGMMAIALLTACSEKELPIDRTALLQRNNVRVTAFDSLSSLSVGNGNFAYTVDATGLQSYPEVYSAGVPLGTQAQWGWHSFPNTKNYKPEETWRIYRFRDKDEPYAVQFNEKGRPQAAANYYRENPHRLHLGHIGLAMFSDKGEALPKEALTNIRQELNLAEGKINSCFETAYGSVSTQTVCHPDLDLVSSKVASKLIAADRLKIRWTFPYPTGKHSDDACDYTCPQRHRTNIIDTWEHAVLLERILDADHYYVWIAWEGNAVFEQAGPHTFYLSSQADSMSFSTRFLAENPLACMSGKKAQEETCPLKSGMPGFEQSASAAKTYWNTYWNEGAVVDFSACTDPRAPELERRVVLSQYITAIQCAGMYPPQETGLTYNSWFGKFHLEMHWWHGVHFALWNHSDLMERSMAFYASAEPIARSIAQRQGFKGVRWMKMTDPSAVEAPSKVGSFLIWQQPHLIYMAELIYRNNPSDTAAWMPYRDLVFETAEFMADFADYDGMGDRYILQGAIPAQETLRASETINSPFELSYWHYALNVAQQWRVRTGMPKNMDWEIVIDKLSPLAYNEDKLYLAAETATDTYMDTRYTSDHMAVLGALGIMPASRLVRQDIMTNTFNWVWDNWNWGKTWGWDYPMTAMCAARLGMPEKAVGALLMDRRTNTYLVNGHNYQDGRLRIYLPGNGGLLTAVAMMCAGWDGSKGENPGFPKDGKWNVRWEGLKRMP